MNGLHVRRLAPAEESAYASFVAGHPDAMVYHSLPYVEFIAALTSAAQETLVAMDSSGGVAGVLPALAKDGPYGRVVNSLPFYGSHGGPLASSATAADALMAGYNALATAPGVASATLIGNPLAREKTGEAQAVHTLTDFRTGQFTSLAFDANHAEALMASFHHKTRNMVRKGQKSGFTVGVENDMTGFLRDVHQENLRALGGRSKPDAFFQELPRYFRPDADFRIFVARCGGEPVAALLLLYFRGTVEYFTPVVREPYRSRQPLSLLIYEAMVDASTRGYLLWNWGGTWPTQDTLYLFKARWGTFDLKYTYYVQINDDAISRASRESLLTQYENFFVVPFHLLQTAPPA